MMRRVLAIVAVVVVLAIAAAGGWAAVGGGGGAATSATPTVSSPPPTVSSSPSVTSATPRPTPSPPAATVPDDAVLIEHDVPASDLSRHELVPVGADVTGSWTGMAGGTEVIVVAYAEPSDDPLDRARGLMRWVRRPDLRGWAGHLVASWPRGDGVLGLDASVGDVTGDGDDDALVVAMTGGTGACGSWSVLDLATGDGVFARDLCDGRIDATRDPTGLSIVEAVYRADDPHCCPSARRTTVLTFVAGTEWAIASRRTTPI